MSIHVHFGQPYWNRPWQWLYLSFGDYQPFKRFGHSGWVCLSVKWLWRYRNFDLPSERNRAERNRLAKLFLLFALLLTVQLAWAQQPRVIIVTAGGDVGNTGTSLNVNCTGGCSAPTDNTTGSTALAGSGQTISVALNGERGAAFQLQSGGTLVATITPKCSFDGGTLYNVNGYIQDPVTGAVTLTATIASAQGTTDYPVMCPQGSSHAQMNVTSFTSGSANFLARATAVTWPGIGWGVVTTAAPSYTTGLIAPVSLTTAGGLRVDGSGVTQPVSLTSTTITGTVAVTESGTWTVQPGNTANTTPWLVTPIPSSASAAASSIFYNQAVTTAVNAKGSAGNVYGWSVYNPNTSVCYLQVFNITSGSVTLGTSVPLFSIPVTNGLANIAPPGGVALNNFSTAISVASTTGPQNATTCTTGMVVNLWFL